MKKILLRQIDKHANKSLVASTLVAPARPIARAVFQNGAAQLIRFGIKIIPGCTYGN